MDRDPGEFEPKRDDASSQDDDDARLEAYIASLPPAPGIKHVDDPDGDDLENALADIAAGRVHSHEIVGKWLKTWGRPDHKPFKEWLAEHDG